MDLHEKFEHCASEVSKLKALPSNDDLLFLYAHYKQAIQGDVKGERPGLFDPRARAKWDAWSAKKGMPKDEAKQMYIEKVEQLIASIGYEQKST